MKRSIAFLTKKKKGAPSKKREAPQRVFAKQSIPSSLPAAGATLYRSFDTSFQLLDDLPDALNADVFSFLSITEINRVSWTSRIRWSHVWGKLPAPARESNSRHAREESAHSTTHEVIVLDDDDESETIGLGQHTALHATNGGTSNSLPRPKWEEDLISNADIGAVWTLLTTLDFSRIKNLRAATSYQQLGLAASRLFHRVPKLCRLVLRGDQTLNFAELHLFPNLTSLTLSLNLHWPTSYLSHIFESTALSHLRLDLRGGMGTGVGSGETPEVWRSFADALPHLKHLKSLSLAARGSISEEIFRLLAEVCCNLEYLCLLAGQNSSCGPLLPLFQASPLKSGLKNLMLSKFQMPLDTLRSILRGNDLLSLSLQHCDPCPLELALPSSSVVLPNLTFLSLRDNPAAKESLVAVLASQCPSLTTLDLSKNRNVGVKVFQSVLACIPCLKSLDMRDCPLLSSSSLAKALGRLTRKQATKCLQIKVLKLSQAKARGKPSKTSMGSEGPLAVAQAFPNLSFLHISRFPGIDSSCLKKMLKLCPRLETLEVPGCGRYTSDFFLSLAHFTFTPRLVSLLVHVQQLSWVRNMPNDSSAAALVQPKRAEEQQRLILKLKDGLLSAGACWSLTVMGC